MSLFLLLAAGIASLIIGAVLGYFARQSIAKRDYQNIEAKIQKRISEAKTEVEEILSQGKEKASQVLETAKNEAALRREELLKMERILLRRENIMDKRLSEFESKEVDFVQKVEKLRQIKDNLDTLREEAEQNLERISGLSPEEAKKELSDAVEKGNQKARSAKPLGKGRVPFIVGDSRWPGDAVGKADGRILFLLCVSWNIDFSHNL